MNIPFKIKQKTNNFRPKAGIFVDASNTYFSEKRAGWKIDYMKLRNFISQEMDVEFLEYYVAVPKKTDKKAYKGKINYLEKIKKDVEIKEKPLKYITEKIFIEGNKILRTIKKGDVDVDITVSVMNKISELDVIIILSGDSDYIALRGDIINKGKKILFMAYKKNLSHEIRQGKYVVLQSIKPFVCFNKDCRKNETPASKGGGTLVPLLYSSKK